MQWLYCCEVSAGVQGAFRALNFVLPHVFSLIKDMLVILKTELLTEIRNGLLHWIDLLLKLCRNNLPLFEVSTIGSRPTKLAVSTLNSHNRKLCVVFSNKAYHLDNLTSPHTINIRIAYLMKINCLALLLL